MMTPSEVSAKLNIQPSTLRKYSASSQEEESEPKTVTPKKDTRSLWARIWNK